MRARSRDRRTSRVLLFLLDRHGPWPSSGDDMGPTWPEDHDGRPLYVKLGQITDNPSAISHRGLKNLNGLPKSWKSEIKLKYPCSEDSEVVLMKFQPIISRYLGGTAVVHATRYIYYFIAINLPRSSSKS